MPQVNPVTVNIDTTDVVLTPAGGNGSGSMSYRSPDQSVNLVIVPKVGDGKKIPDRATVRMNLAFQVTDPLDPSKQVVREAFFRGDFTLPPTRDITTGEVVSAVVAALQSGQTTGVLNGETFW